MKLSDAIRLGAMLKPQAFDGSTPGKSCALRAAADAVGIKDFPPRILNYAEIRERWPFLYGDGQCPRCKHSKENLGWVIYHLNDDHRWTREQIADWVETLESSQSVDAVREPSDRAVSPVRV